MKSILISAVGSLCFILSLSLSSCAENIEVVFEDYEGYLSQEELLAKFNLVYTANDSIFRMSEDGELLPSPTGYSNSSTDRFIKPRLNYQRNKLACIDMPSGRPVIFDLVRNRLFVAVDVYNASSIAWAPNGESLIIIYSDQLAPSPPAPQQVMVYGPSYSASDVYTVLNNPNRFIDELAIAMDGRICTGFLEGNPQPLGGENYIRAELDDRIIEFSVNRGNNRIQRLSFSGETGELLARFSFPMPAPPDPDHFIIESDDTRPDLYESIPELNGEEIIHPVISMDGSSIAYAEQLNNNTYAIKVYNRLSGQSRTIKQVVSRTPIHVDIK